MRTRGLLVAALVLPALTGAARMDAQRDGYTYLSYVGTDVQLVSQGQEDTSARVNTPVLAGDRLSTASASRAEAILADGTIVRADGRTDVRFDRLARTHEADDERDLLYLERGSLAVEARQAPSGGLRVDTDDATVLLEESGAFRIDTGGHGTEVYVLSGRVEINARSGRAEASAGEVAHVNGSDEIEVERAEVPRDAFTRFCEDRGERRGPATRYVSAEYDYDYQQSDLDDNGSWGYASTYGRYGWRPRVTADWSPYSLGSWRWTPCGLTWVSYESWGWLPYHYGTWAYDSGGWCWLPGTLYSPAWVYWSYSPSYVGWCPVGYYGYYDGYARSLRGSFGYESAFCYPHLRGRVDLAQIDPRGWNFVSAQRVAGRLDPRQDIVSGSRIRFRSGEIGVVATAPLRVDRPSSGSVAVAVREAVRRVPTVEVASRVGPRRVDAGLTAVLRRETSASPLVQEELRRTAVRAGHDPLCRPQAAEAIARREAPSAARGDGIAIRGVDATRRPDARLSGGPRPIGPREGGTVEGRGAWREASRTSDAPIARVEPRRGEVSASPRGDDGWRAQGGRAAAPRSADVRRVESVPAPRGDGGWRAPEHAVSPRREGPPGHAADAPRRESPPPSREAPVPAPPRAEPPHRENRSAVRENAGAPWRDERGYGARHPEAPASRGWDAQRFEPRPAPRAYEPPRYEPRPAPRAYEPPRYEARPAPAPRSYEPRYENRSAPAPRSEPHAAPAPRFESHPAPAPQRVPAPNAPPAPPRRPS